MREGMGKYRGKMIDNDQWIYGSLITGGVNPHSGPIGNTFILTDEADFGDVDEVYPSSVGQFTGLKDKNGVEIYEGDVMEDFSGCEPLYVIFNTDWGGFCVADDYGIDDRFDESFRKCEIIGNIHDKEPSK